MVSDALDDRCRSGVSDEEPLPHDSGDEHASRRRAVPDDVACDDVLLRGQHSRGIRSDDDAAAGESLAHVVVGIPVKPEREASRDERAERLARRTRQRDRDGVLRQALLSEPPGHLVTEHRSDGASGVRYRRHDRHTLSVRECWSALRDEIDIEVRTELVLLVACVPALCRGGCRGRGENRREVESLGLPMGESATRIDEVDSADRLVEAAETELSEELSDLLGDELEERHNELRPACEPRTKQRILGGDADRAGVEMADAHHDASRDDERRGREPELLRAEQRGDDDVPPRLQLPVHLDDDTVAQLVHHQRLLCLGEPQLPRRAGMLERVQRARTGSAIVTGDEQHIAQRLGHAGRDGSDSGLADEFGVDAC